MTQRQASKVVDFRPLPNKPSPAAIGKAIAVLTSVYTVQLTPLLPPANEDEPGDADEIVL